MDRAAIEREARKVQFEVWSRRQLLWPLGEPPIEAMFDPQAVCRVLDLRYELREHIGAQDGGGGFEAAGILDRRNEVVAISTRFPYAVQRFTAAHEIGHFVLHPHVGGQVLHRDRPIYDLRMSNRPLIERDADYFGACLLVPVKLLVSAFEARFGTRRPLPLTETVAFHLKSRDPNGLFSAPKGSLAFASAVARAQSFDRRHFKSLAEQFGVSIGAMAIRLREIGLVVD